MAYPFDHADLAERGLSSVLGAWGLQPGDLPSEKVPLLVEAADVIGDGTRSARLAAAVGASNDGPPQLDNMGGATSQPPRYRASDLKSGLLDPAHYRRALSLRDPSHWSLHDPALFASLPQGGGGVDCLHVTFWGRLTDDGREMLRLFMVARGLDRRDFYRCKREGEAAGLSVVSAPKTGHEGVVIEHPAVVDDVLFVAATGSGRGRSHQPIMLKRDGIVIRYGSRWDSKGEKESGTCSSGPLGFIELHGTQFLQRGESMLLLELSELLQSLGIEVKRLRASRIDLAADLPEADIGVYRALVDSHGYVSKSRGSVKQYFAPGTGEFTGLTVESATTMLRIYEKSIECRDADKRALMIANRWGSDVQQAVRVEFQIRFGRGAAREYDSVQELLMGVGELLAWAMNVWFRFTVVDDRTHTSRAEVADCWLRVQHAFAWWASRLNNRVTPPSVDATAPPEALIAQMRGLLCAVCARTGIVPKDNETVFAVAASWLSNEKLAERVAEKAAQLRVEGVELGEVGPPSEGTVWESDDERQYWSVKQWREFGARAEVVDKAMAFNG